MESVYPVKVFQGFVSVYDVETDTVLKLAQTYGAEVERPGIAFLQMVGSIHTALEEYAMMETEHMPCLMGEHPAAALEEYFSVIGIAPLPVERGIIACEAVHADALGERGLAEDKIP
jgi:hypothetical protein